MSHPEVLRALQAARNVPVTAEIEVAAPASPQTAPPVTVTVSTDDASARPSAEASSDPAPTSPASTLPRPGATAGPLLEAAAAATSSSSTTTTVTTTPPPVETSSTTTSTAKDTKSDPKKPDRSTSSTTTTTRKPSTTTTTSKSSTSRTQTRTLRSRGGVVTVTWSNDGVKGVARPESGYTARFISNGPDKVEVWFWTEGRASQIVARADGTTTVTDWKCSNRPRFHCAPV